MWQFHGTSNKNFNQFKRYDRVLFAEFHPRATYKSSFFFKSLLAATLRIQFVLEYFLSNTAEVTSKGRDDGQESGREASLMEVHLSIDM